MFSFTWKFKYESNIDGWTKYVYIYIQLYKQGKEISESCCPVSQPHYLLNQVLIIKLKVMIINKKVTLIFGQNVNLVTDLVVRL